jgi:hypothetical protein
MKVDTIEKQRRSVRKSIANNDAHLQQTTHASANKCAAAEERQANKRKSVSVFLLNPMVECLFDLHRVPKYETKKKPTNKPPRNNM